MTQELTIREPRELSLPDSATLEQELKAVRAFQATVKKLLVEGHDFGVIPGTQKPTLLKPGAEKIDKILHLADTYEVLNQIDDWQKGFFHYEFKCRLIVIGTDVVVSEGMGSCNSMESKYRYRWVFESGLPRDIDKETLPTKKVRVKGNWTSTYRIDNDDPYTLANTILKMAKKRAHIDATLSAGRLSDVFTQDIEDMPHIADEIPSEETQESQSSSKEHWCEKHQTNFFKKGKMKSYAHPIDGSKDADGRSVWCYENSKAESSPDAPQSTREPGVEAKAAPVPEEAEAAEEQTEELSGAASKVDPGWLKETLALIHWPDATALSWIKAQCKVDADNLKEAIAVMDDDQLKKFVGHITAMSEAAGG